jgi:hypothetical protein
MTKIYIFLLVCLCTSLTLSALQTSISGKVIAKDDNLPIAYANIIYKHKNTGTFSDEDGYFSLNINQAAQTDLIIISHIGYETLNISLKEALSKKVFVLQRTQLEQVVLSAKSNFNLNSFIKEVVKTYNKGRKKDPHIAVAYYNESAKIKEDYIMYMESIGYSIFSGKMANAAKYSNYKFFSDNSRFYITNPEWTFYNDHEDRAVRPSASANLRALRVLEYQGILSSKNYKKHKFKQDSTFYDFRDNLIRRISFKGNGDKGFIDVKASNFEILEINYSTNKFFSTIKNKELQADVRMRFNYYEGSPYLNMVSGSYNYNNLRHEIYLKILTQKFKEFNFSKEEYWAINDYNINPFVRFNSKIWNSFNIDSSKVLSVSKTLKPGVLT